MIAWLIGMSDPARSDRYQRCSSTSWNTSAGSSLPVYSRGTARIVGSYTLSSQSWAARSSSSPWRSLAAR